MKKWVKIVLSFITVILFFLFLLWLNAVFAKCDVVEHYNNSTEVCQYIATQCKAGEEGDGTYCWYEPEGFLSSAVIWVIVIVILILGLFFVVISMYKKSATNSAQIASEFDKKDYVTPDRAKDILLERIVKENGIWHWEDKNGFHYRKDDIRVSLNREPFIKKNYEWFVQFEIELFEGKSIGIYTTIISLSRGEEWIIGGQYRLRRIAFDDYVESPSKRPMYQLSDKEERKYQALMEQGRTEEANRVLVEATSTPQQTELSPEEQAEERELQGQAQDKRRIENRSRYSYNRRNVRY